MKRIITMQDISGIGKCSLTVAIPVLSSMGIETAVIPTAVLSTHTMFKGFTFHDLTQEIEPIINHWKKEGFTFDALYTGYLGSIEQIELADKLFETFGENAVILVDPCMADSGKLYTGFNDEFVAEMRKLCSKADIICPNMTEASLLLDIPYQEHYNEAYVKEVLQKLTTLGSTTAILTGVTFGNHTIGAYAYNSANGEYYSYMTQEETEYFHGTGDLWASTFLGALMREKDFTAALQIACDFVKEAIHKTLEEKNHNIYGVSFEQAIPSLLEMLNY